MICCRMRDVEPISFEKHILSKDLCASASHSDNLLCSKTISVVRPVVDIGKISDECSKLWSPGMVLFITDGNMTEVMFNKLMEKLVKLSSKLGRARRITVGGFLLNEATNQRLYKCFYCVECVDSQGVTTIVGAEQAV